MICSKKDIFFPFCFRKKKTENTEEKRRKEKKRKEGNFGNILGGVVKTLEFLGHI